MEYDNTKYSVKMLFQSKNHLRGEMIGKAWVMYRDTNKGK